MSKTNDRKKKARMPYAGIALLSLLMMPFGMFVLDSPIVFWLSFLVCVAAVTAWAHRWDKDTQGCSLPWWYGGL